MNHTLSAPARHEEVIKRSRFLAHAAPVSSEADTLAFFESVADASATHNCWAWRLNYRVRFNDDGEPGGTAGRPILGAIEGRGLDGVMIVVTRWFGGIKLGAGGLVRAYSGAAAKCLDQARVVPKFEWAACEVRADFALASTLHGLLDQAEARQLQESFTPDGVNLAFEVRADRLQALETAVKDASRGEAAFFRRRD